MHIMANHMKSKTPRRVLNELIHWTRRRFRAKLRWVGGVRGDKMRLLGLKDLRAAVKDRRTEWWKRNYGL